MIDSMFQEGTDRALDDQVRRPVVRPEPITFGLGRTVLGAPVRGTAAGVVQIASFASEVTGAFGQFAERLSYSLLPENNDAQRAYKDAAKAKPIDWSNPEGDYLRTAARDILPDPNTSHVSEQVVAGLFEFGAKAISYSLAAGPLAGASLLGADAGLTEADRLKREGVDLETRTKAAAVAGGIAGASVLIPMTGPSAAARFGIGSATGAAGVVGQAAIEREILKAGGYDKVAATFDPFDWVSLSVGALVPGVLGAALGRPAVKPAKPVKPSAGGAEYDKLNAVQRAAELSPDRLGVLRQELADPATNPAERARLQAQIDAIEAQGAIRGTPDADAAVRVAQVVRALDESRPEALDTLAGRDAHVSAVELAADQIGRGESVQVADSLMPHIIEGAQREANFRAWFGESKAVDAEGKPLVVYHGTSGDFDHFASSALGINTNAASAKAAFFFSDSPTVASGYALGSEISRDNIKAKLEGRPLGDETREMVGDLTHGGWTESNVMPIHLALENPLVVEYHGKDYRERRFSDVIKEAKENGHDGVIFRNTEDSMHKGYSETSNVYAIFDPRQAKSAIGNSGRFDPNSASLTDPLPRFAEGIANLAELRQPQEPPARATATPEAANREAPPSAGSAGEAQPAAGSAGAGAAGDVQAAGVARAADEVARLNPDMLVQLDGMDSPVPVSELMARIREEAASDAEFGKLVEVAAQCALRT